MTINTDNLVNDFINNLAEIFNNNMKKLGLKEVFLNDVLVIPATPSISLSCTGLFPTRLTMGRNSARYQFNFVGEIWYYHAVISNDIDRNLVMRSAYVIAEHIMQNSTLNGWIATGEAVVRSCVYLPRLRSGTFFACAKIMILAPYLTRITSQ